MDDWQEEFELSMQMQMRVHPRAEAIQKTWMAWSLDWVDWSRLG
jgi:hypothetical protein